MLSLFQDQDIERDNLLFLFHFKYPNSFCYIRNAWDIGDPIEFS